MYERLAWLEQVDAGINSKGEKLVLSMTKLVKHKQKLEKLVFTMVSCILNKKKIPKLVFTMVS